MENALPRTNFSYKDLFTSETFYYYIVICTMILIPLSELFGQVIYQVPFVFERSFLTLVGLVGFVIVVSNILVSKKFKVIDVVYLIFVGVASVAGLTVKQLPDAQMFNISGHIEELSHYMGYYFLMYSAFKISIDRYKLNLLYAIIFISILHNIPGIFQLFGMRLCVSYNQPEMHESLRCIYGLASHCNFYAGLSIIFVSVSLGLYFFRQKSVINNKFLFFVFLNVFCSICSSTRIALLGLSVIYCSLFVIVVLKFIKAFSSKLNFIDTRNYLYKLFVFHIVLIVSALLVIVFFPQLLLPSIEEFLNDFGVFSSVLADNYTQGQIETFATNRMQIWKLCFESIQRNLFLGVGIGNFVDIYISSGHMQDYQWIVQSAHNQHLHTFVVQGLVGFACYCFVIIVAIVNTFKNIWNGTLFSKAFFLIVLLVIFSYIVQATFNCSIFELVPYFWIFLGLALNYKKIKDRN